MSQITHKNHFVPQLYLKQWSDDGTRIWSYRILVSHDKVPEWDHPTISEVAYQSDLYTTCINGKEGDDFEKWLATEFESPVNETIKKVLKDSNLSALDWERLAMFLGAQDVRTPVSYLDSMERWAKSLPELLQDTLEKSVHQLEQRQAHDERIASREM